MKDFDPIMELHNNVYLTTFYSGNVTTSKLQDLINFVEKYNVNVRPENQYLESSHSFGKVIVKIG